MKIYKLTKKQGLKTIAKELRITAPCDGADEMEVIDCIGYRDENNYDVSVELIFDEEYGIIGDDEEYSITSTENGVEVNINGEIKSLSEQEFFLELNPSSEAPVHDYLEQFIKEEPQGKTTIQISKKTKQSLMDAKITPDETYESVIKRLLME